MIDTSDVIVYNFTVDNVHTYYVSDLSLLVHNLCLKPKWGEIYDYAAGKMNAIDHILQGHSFNSAVSGKSKFLEKFSTKSGLKELIGEAIGKANSKTDLVVLRDGTGNIISKTVTYTFDETIGLSQDGKKTKAIEVILDAADNVKTAYPK